MNRTPLIAPSILSADFTCLGEQLAAVEAAGADWIHVDVMDGHFVPNLTMGPFIVEHVRRVTCLPIDVHLMVESPGSLLEPFAWAGATNLTIHVETSPNPGELLARIRSLGCCAGLTLNPATPASALADYLPLADLVLVMTVHPGYSGQSFMPDMIAKIGEVRRLLDKLGSPAWLEVDGGISAATIRQTREAGADAFVAANAIFKNPQGIAAGISALRTAIGG
jgi:ribulose-phosphate 3-epimerase